MSNVKSSGSGVAGLLGVAFVVLKLTHTITWPWLWVLAPFWIPLCIAILVMLTGIALLLFVNLID